MANEEGRGTYPRCGQRKISTTRYALKIVRGTCGMAQSKDSWMEKLLLHELQPKEISETELVYSAAINPVVCEEETTRKMDEIPVRS